ncbi:MAG: hypothetical protein NFCOHLIN_02390 [Gammaproteobacteria bacterium]|nr:hypothetical protein [Gammaproteobacteria bacterium]
MLRDMPDGSSEKHASQEHPIMVPPHLAGSQESAPAPSRLI